MKSAVLIGDYENAKYHPLIDVDTEMINIFQGSIKIDVVSEYENLTLEDLLKYDMLIDYADQWRNKGSDRLAAAMISYVVQGGALLSIHNGIIKGTHYELAAMQGGAMFMHPPYTYLPYQILCSHPIATGLEELEMNLEEEPYVFEMDAFMESNLFLSYSYGELKKPAGWTREFGKGRVCYIAPGHNVITFKNVSFRQILRRCGLWACREF